MISGRLERYRVNLWSSCKNTTVASWAFAKSKTHLSGTNSSAVPLSIVILAFALLVTACSNPVPEGKLNYVGEWRSKEMYLLILKDGTVSYKRLKGGGNVSINGPLKEFVGNNFVVGVAFLTTTFEVSQTPELINGVWKMTVDGVQLTKSKE